MNIRALLLGLGLGIALSPICAVKNAHGQAAILVALFGDKVASENFYFSLKGGLNFSSLGTEANTDFQRGPNFGMLANIRFGERWGIVPEFAAFSIRGAEGDVNPRSRQDPEGARDQQKHRGSCQHGCSSCFPNR